MAMAPNLSQIILYEAPNHIASYTAILIQMAEDDAASQLSSSWFPPSGPSETLEQILMQLGAQGQSIFQASGDFGAYTNGVPGQSTDPHETIVGGTILGFYQQETVWNNGVSNQV